MRNIFTRWAPVVTILASTSLWASEPWVAPMQEQINQRIAQLESAIAVAQTASEQLAKQEARADEGQYVFANAFAQSLGVTEDLGRPAPTVVWQCEEIQKTLPISEGLLKALREFHSTIARYQEADAQYSYADLVQKTAENLSLLAEKTQSALEAIEPVVEIPEHIQTIMAKRFMDEALTPAEKQQVKEWARAQGEDIPSSGDESDSMDQ